MSHGPRCDGTHATAFLYARTDDGARIEGCLMTEHRTAAVQVLHTQVYVIGNNMPRNTRNPTHSRSADIERHTNLKDGVSVTAEELIPPGQVAHVES